MPAGKTLVACSFVTTIPALGSYSSEQEWKRRCWVTPEESANFSTPLRRAWWPNDAETRESSHKKLDPHVMPLPWNEHTACDPTPTEPMLSAASYPTREVPALNGLHVLETTCLELPRDALPLTARHYGDFGGTARSFQ